MRISHSALLLLLLFVFGCAPPIGRFKAIIKKGDAEGHIHVHVMAGSNAPEEIMREQLEIYSEIALACKQGHLRVEDVATNTAPTEYFTDRFVKSISARVSCGPGGSR